MKLFGIRQHSNKTPIPNLFFQDKQVAKTERDALTKETGIPHVVTYGPDHHRFMKSN